MGVVWYHTQWTLILEWKKAGLLFNSNETDTRWRSCKIKPWRTFYYMKALAFCLQKLAEAALPPNCLNTNPCIYPQSYYISGNVMQIKFIVT